MCHSVTLQDPQQQMKTFWLVVSVVISPWGQQADPWTDHFAETMPFALTLLTLSYLHNPILGLSCSSSQYCRFDFGLNWPRKKKKKSDVGNMGAEGAGAPPVDILRPVQVQGFNEDGRGTHSWICGPRCEVSLNTLAPVWSGLVSFSRFNSRMVPPPPPPSTTPAQS